ncbi:MAG: hypothetical protein IT340_08460 [Chloroflexi bacterium]|nr:hypothetical protein [Chloroflexota bacterium]
MYAVMRLYTLGKAEDLDEIVRRAGEGFVPLVRAVPGFVSYSIVQSGNQAATISIFEDRAGADESVRAAAMWVKQYLGPLLPNPPRVTGGEIRVRVVNAGVQPGFGVARRYSVNVAAIGEIMRRAEAEFVPQLKRLSGLARYSILDEGDGHITSLSAFDSQASADESTRVAGAWVRDALGPHVYGAPDVLAGEFKLAVVA